MRLITNRCGSVISTETETIFPRLEYPIANGCRIRKLPAHPTGPLDMLGGARLSLVNLLKSSINK